MDIRENDITGNDEVERERDDHDRAKSDIIKVARQRR